MVDLVSLNNGNPMNRSVTEIGYPPHPGLKPLVSREGLMGTFSSISGLYYELTVLSFYFMKDHGKVWRGCSTKEIKRDSCKKSDEKQVK